MDIDLVLDRIADRLQSCRRGLSERQIERLAAELFLEGARFALAWAEGPDGAGSPPCASETGSLPDPWAGDRWRRQAAARRQ